MDNTQPYSNGHSKTAHPSSLKPRKSRLHDELLREREQTHGDFATNAAISQALKDAFDLGTRPENAVHREALDMIALKLSRIISGQADFKDHWDDIAGYAKLGSEACDATSDL